MKKLLFNLLVFAPSFIFSQFSLSGYINQASFDSVTFFVSDEMGEILFEQTQPLTNSSFSFDLKKVVEGSTAYLNCGDFGFFVTLKNGSQSSLNCNANYPSQTIRFSGDLAGANDFVNQLNDIQKVNLDWITSFGALTSEEDTIGLMQTFNEKNKKYFAFLQNGVEKFPEAATIANQCDFSHQLQMSGGFMLIEQRLKAVKLMNGDPNEFYSLQAYNQDEKLITVKDFRGKPLLIHLWATWCKPCIEEMDELKKIEQEYTAEMNILHICVGSPKEDFSKLSSELGLDASKNMFITANSDNMILLSPHTNILPAYKLLDQDGLMISRNLGRPSGAMREDLNVLKK